MNIFKTHFKDKSKEDFIICGHRGWPSLYPENTLYSFERAWMAGANALELDLCISKDGIVFVWHDWYAYNEEALLRAAGVEPDTGFMPVMELKYPVNFYTFNEIQEKCYYKSKILNVEMKKMVPTLDEFIKWVEDKKEIKYLFFDIKAQSPSAHHQIVDIVARDTKYLDQEIIIESFSRVYLMGDQMNHSKLSYGLDISLPIGFVREIEQYALLPTEYNKRIFKYVVPMRPTALTFWGWMNYKRFIKINMRNPQKQICATINDEEEMRYLYRAGVKGIQTNHPDILKGIVK